MAGARPDAPRAHRRTPEVHADQPRVHAAKLRVSRIIPAASAAIPRYRSIARRECADIAKYTRCEPAVVADVRRAVAAK
jgi:hypothetical protein